MLNTGQVLLKVPAQGYDGVHKLGVVDDHPQHPEARRQNRVPHTFTLWLAIICHVVAQHHQSDAKEPVVTVCSCRVMVWELL